MPFPISLHGYVRLDATSARDPGSILTAIQRALADQRPTTLTASLTRVEFTAGMRRGVWANWNLLLPISRGSVEFLPSPSSVTLHYHLRFTQLLIITSAMVLGFFGPFVAFAANLDIPAKIGLLGVTWLWLFGGNYVLTAIRFPAFLRRAASRLAA